MLTAKESTTFIEISELRTNWNSILEAAKYSKIIIGRRNKAIAVLMDIDAYNKIDNLIEEWTDSELAEKPKNVQLKQNDHNISVPSKLENV